MINVKFIDVVNFFGTFRDFRYSDCLEKSFCKMMQEIVAENLGRVFSHVIFLTVQS